MASSMFQLMYTGYHDSYVRKTLGIYNDVNDLFKKLRDDNLNSVYLEVYKLVPGFPDYPLKPVWNNCALWDDEKKTIAYVASTYEDKMEAIAESHTRLKTLRATADDKLIMVKSLMNLDAKNTKAPVSMSVLLTSYISLPNVMERIITEPHKYLENLQKQVQQLQYVNHLLDEWIVDRKKETGFDGELSELIKEEPYRKVPAIAFP